MKICIDVGYNENKANVACLVFENWEDEKPVNSYKIQLKGIEDYQPGEFYNRELPCILKVLQEIREPVDLIVLDSYVWLDENKKPGLGAYLYNEMNSKIPIIGVAKNKFISAEKFSKEIYRGDSIKPLYVSTVGMDLEEAKKCIEKMYGEYRIPYILKLVDQLSRDWS